MTGKRLSTRWIETLLVVTWFVAFVTLNMAFRGLGFLDAISQILTPLSIVLSVLVVFGIIGIANFIAGLRGQ